jgi:hypothetical protein
VPLIGTHNDLGDYQQHLEPPNSTSFVSTVPAIRPLALDLAAFLR